MATKIFFLFASFFFFCLTAHAVIVIQDNGIVKTYDCNGDRVVLEGSRNQVTLTGQCKEVAVDGDENKVQAESAASIAVDGNDNKVTWGHEIDGKPPRVTTDGFRNTVEQATGHPVASQGKGKGITVSTNDGKQVSVSAGKSGVNVTTGDGKSVTVGADKHHGLDVQVSGAETTGGEGAVVLNEDKIEKTVACNGRQVVINGDHCNLILSGDCGTVSIQGDSNEVVIDATDTISITGDDNKVSWKKAIKGDRPTINNNGDQNSVEQLEQ